MKRGPKPHKIVFEGTAAELLAEIASEVHMTAPVTKKNAALHSAATDVWGTPPELIKLARHTLGWIDCDPATDATWNLRIGAYRILTAQDDGTQTPWMIGGPKPAAAATLPCLDRDRHYHVFCNPPGDKSGELVAAYWRALAGYVATGWVTAAIWVGFSVEQLARLQRVGAVSHPLQHTTVILATRPRFLKAFDQAGDAPSHAGYVTLLSAPAHNDLVRADRRHVLRNTFLDAAAHLGAGVGNPFGNF